MEAREAFQRSVFEIVEQMVLDDLFLSDDMPQDDTLEVNGFWYPFETVLETFSVYRNHGILPHAGGWLDQSMLWRKDMRKMTRLYNYFFAEHKDDKRDG